MRVLLTFTISIMLTCGLLHAQSDFDLTQRLFNESIYNPGAVGNSFTTGVFLHGRSQWTGMNGAPQTQAATFDTYVNYLRSGFGVSVTRDKIGYYTSHTARVSYAYYIPISYQSTLALGLSGGVLHRNRNITDDMAFDPNDPALLYNHVNTYDPEFDFGLEYKGPFKLGISVRHLGFYKNDYLTDPSMNVWAYISSRFNILDDMSVEPIFSYTLRNSVSRYELGGLLYFLKMGSLAKYSERFWVGAVVRFNGQFAVLGGVNLTKQMRVGYSFEYGMKGDLISISEWGTHEIFVSWQLNRIFYKDPLCPAYGSYKGKRRR